MKRFVRLSLFGPLALCAVLTVVYAATPTATVKTETKGNSYNLYTKALRVDDFGVVAIPPRYKWSVETSWRGSDLQGNDLPDSRVMLRLYDPDHNFTALTAQMDLETAERLQRDLADIIAKKRSNPHYQFRPQLYSPDKIPTGRLFVNENGVLDVELDYSTIDHSDSAPKPLPVKAK